MKKLSIIIVAILVSILMLAGLSTPALADPGIGVSPSAYDFGYVALGSSSSTIITIQNIGLNDIDILDVFFSGSEAADFSFTGPTATWLPPDSTTEVEITYSPIILGSVSCDFIIVSSESSVTVTLTGSGAIDNTPPVVEIIPVAPLTPSGPLNFYFVDESLDGMPGTGDRTASGAVQFNVSGMDDVTAPENLTIESNPASGEPFLLGDNTVVVTVTDEAGNSNTVEFTVTIRNIGPAPADANNPPTVVLDGGSMWVEFPNGIGSTGASVTVKPRYTVPGLSDIPTQEGFFVFGLGGIIVFDIDAEGDTTSSATIYIIYDPMGMSPSDQENAPIKLYYNGGTGPASWVDITSGPKNGHCDGYNPPPGGGTVCGGPINLDEVTVQNNPPELDSIGDKTVYLGQTLSFTVTAIDADGDTVTLTVSNLPAIATFTSTPGNPGTGVVSMTPTAADVGTYVITFTATDDGAPMLSDSETITITVNEVNQAPVMTYVPNQEVATDPVTGALLLNSGVILMVTVTATDPNPADSLTLSAFFGTQGNLPAGATFSQTGPNMGLFEWTPTPAQEGVWGPGGTAGPPLSLRADDDGTPPLFDMQVVTISVGPSANVPPTLDFFQTNTQTPISQPILATEGDTITFDLVSSDPNPADNLIISVSGSNPLPAGATLVQTSVGYPNPVKYVFTWITGTGGAGTYNIDFFARDSGAPSISNEIPVTIIVISVNDTTAPVPDVDPLPDVTGECSATILTAPTATDDCAGTITATTTDPLTYTAYDDGEGVYTVTWTYDDGNGNISTQTQTVVVDDATAPVPDVDPLPDVTGECSATILTAPTATDGCAGTITATTTDPLTYTEQGMYAVTWTYDDGNGNISTQTQTVVVDDAIAPVITLLGDNPQTIECGDTYTELGATASDDCCGNLNSYIDIDASAVDTATVGTYTVSYDVTDCNGIAATQVTRTIEVVITDDEGPETFIVVASPNPAFFDESVIITAIIDDSGTGGSTIASAEYSLDGGDWMGMDAVDDNFDEVTEEVIKSIGLLPTGVYSICVRGIDKAGNHGDLECILLAVYDPNGGFVTGGGWIDSPEGAYADDPSLTGKAHFGFVSKYKRGASVPSGNTEFIFKAGDLNFHISSYEWLVVTGSDYARFKGAGTINNEVDPQGNPYKFMLWAGDDDLDTFRIRIWYEFDDTEVVIYDNGMDQPIGGGSIVIHTSNK